MKNQSRVWFGSRFIRFTSAVYILLWVGMLAWAWAPALAVGFLADDYEWMSIVRQVEPGNFWKLFLPRSIEPVRVMYRPLVGLLFWADWRIWGLSPVGYHLTNLWFHTITVIGVFFLARLLWGKPRQDGALVGALAATLFAVNPLSPEAVTWVDGRYDVVASAFLVWSLLLFIWSLKARNSLLILFVSLSLAFVSLLAKEIGLVYPFLLLSIMIYKDRDRNNTKWYEVVRRFIKRRGGQLLGAAGVVGLYLLVSPLALERPFWQVKGYAAGISRPFLLWAMLAVLVFVAQRLRRRISLGIGWLAWMLIGLSLMPVALLPTQLRFLYLPSAMACVWLSLITFTVLKRIGKRRWLLSVTATLTLVFAVLLRMQNQAWLEASRLQQRIIASVRSQLSARAPETIYLFHLPDHVGQVPLFRTYVAEAVLLGFREPSAKVRVIPGPRTADLRKSSFKLLDPNQVQGISDSGFIVFEPTIRQRFADGRVEIAGDGWVATMSGDYRQTEITLSQALDGEGVMGLVFEEGSIQEVFLDGE